MDHSHPRLAAPRPDDAVDEGPAAHTLPRPPPPPLLADRLREVPGRLTPQQWLGAAAALLLIVGAGAFWLAGRRASGPAVEAELALATPAATTTTSTAADLTVHVAGAVASPGLQIVPGGARVADAVAAAGGLTPDADLDRVNLAAIVADAQRVYVPRHGEAVPTEVSSGVSSDGSTAPPIVDLNSAGRDLLDTLPGVGPATADAIVEFRASAGPFTSVDGLLEVPGIGPAKLEGLLDRVTVG